DIELAVLHDPHGGVFVVDRLVAALDVDDREAPHAEGHTVELDAPLVIGSAMNHGGAHARHQVSTIGWITARDATNPTHLFGVGTDCLPLPPRGAGRGGGRASPASSPPAAWRAARASLPRLP